MHDDGRHEHHVVIVDDDELTLDLVEHALAFKASAYPVEVHATVDALAATAVVEGLRGRLLCIVDHHLPGRSGEEAIDALRGLGDVHLVYLTGDPDPRIRRRVAPRVDDFLLKPDDPRDYIRLIGDVLSSWLDGRHADRAVAVGAGSRISSPGTGTG